MPSTRGMLTTIAAMLAIAGCVGSPGPTVSPSATGSLAPSSPAGSSGSQTGSPTPSASTGSPSPTATSTVVPPPTESTAPPPSTTPSWTCPIDPGLVGKDISIMPTAARVVALTFDGGATAAGAASIVATLRATGTPATFFFTGQFAQAYPSIARDIANHYPIGNHTMTHPYLTQLSDAAVLREIRDGASAIRSVTGDDPRPYFRFPYGDVNARVIRLVNGECYVPFRWTVDSLGWKGTSGGMTVDLVKSRVLDALVPGAIVLMHLGNNPDDGSTLDADALPALIDEIRARGYVPVTLEEVLPQTVG